MHMDTVNVKFYNIKTYVNIHDYNIFSEYKFLVLREIKKIIYFFILIIFLYNRKNINK